MTETLPSQRPPDSKALPPNTPNRHIQQAQFFISYSRSDRLAVDRLYADLTRQSYQLWMDVSEDGIEPGENWRDELIKQLSASEAVIVCASPDFLKSPYCRAEIEQALREKKPIYPLVVRRLNADQSLADFDLEHLQFIDLTQNYAAGMRRLTQVLPHPRFAARTVARRLGFAAAAVLSVMALFLGIIFAVSSVVPTQPTITPIPPTATPHFASNEVGVLVSYFVLGENTTPADQAQANALIEGLSSALQNEVVRVQGAENGGKAFPIRVIGPQGVDPIFSTDKETRKAMAGVLAQKRDGTAVVVYGVIGRNSVTNQFDVQPEFYVAPGKNFADAQDITGSYALGKNLLIDPASRVQLQETFVSRLRALTFIIEGLSQHILRNYVDALKAYKSALAVQGWADQDGREVLYTLRGNSYMRLAEQAASACKRDDVLANVNTAQEDYEKSKELNSSYVRAYAGLANTQYFSALWANPGNDACKERRVRSDFLQAALQYVKQGNEIKTTDAATARNLLLNQAQIQFVLWLTNVKNENLYKDFVSTTDQLIAKYDRKDGITAAFPVMEGYILRGFAHQNRGAGNPEAYRAAITEYEQAMAIYNDTSFKDLLAPARAMTIAGWQGDCYLNLADYPNAEKFYKLAQQIAQATNNQAAIKSYQDRLKTLDARRLGTPTPRPSLAPPVTVTPDTF